MNSIETSKNRSQVWLVSVRQLCCINHTEYKSVLRDKKKQSKQKQTNKIKRSNNKKIVRKINNDFGSGTGAVVGRRILTEDNPVGYAKDGASGSHVKCRRDSGRDEGVCGDSAGNGRHERQ